MFDLSKFISPVKGLQMMKKGIELNLKQNVDHFQVDYLPDKSDISIKVWLPDGKTMRESWKGAGKEQLIFMIDSFLKSHLKSGQVLDLATCEYNPDETVNLSICFTQDGEKKIEQIKNYKP